jgi:hypothetical protein
MGVWLQMSKPVRLSYGKVTYVGTLWISVVLLMVLSGELSAGSIFMKNGYVIQGPIVERDEAAITMGWPNGKVMIQRRFIDSVTFEQEEERRLQEDEAHRAGAARKRAVEGPYEFLSDPDELPPDLDALILQLSRDGADGLQNTVGSGSPLLTGPGTEPDASSSVPADANVFVRPGALLGERVIDPQMAVSFRPPQGWSVQNTGRIFNVVGPPDSDEFLPSINVVCLPMGALSEEEYIAHLKEDNARTLQSFELLSERSRSVGGESAYELVGRGSRGERQAILRQVLFEKDGTLWLVSAFTSGVEGDDSFSTIEETLESFEFTSF